MTEVRALATAWATRSDSTSADLDRTAEIFDLRPALSVADRPRLLEWLRSRPGVTIGLAGPDSPPEVTDAFDVVSPDEDTAARISAAVRGHPTTSVTLAQLLRMGSTLDVDHALVAESLAYSTLQAGPEFAEWLRTSPRPAPDPRSDPCVVVERDGDTLRLMLDRPERRNAYSAAMRDELVAALDLILLDHTIERAVLGGRGTVFCAGGDLAEFGSTPDPATAHRIRTLRSAGRSIHGVRERLTVVMHGDCVGAGVELPAFAGHVVADPETTFRLPEVAMGLVPGAGGTVAIARRIGRQRLLGWALAGEAIDAVTAQAWGLIDEVAALPGE